MFNATLLRQGLAQVATSPPASQHADSFYDWQGKAQAYERGIWDLPGKELCKLAAHGNAIGKGTTSCAG